MHGINNVWMRLLVAAAVFTCLVSISALAQEGGMIPLDSPTGEIGGRGHWYSLRTMKAEDYYTKAPKMSDIMMLEDGEFAVTGEPPVDLAIVLHPRWGYAKGEPWREALNWVREAEQMFRNSGVPIRFVVRSIATWDEMPDTVEAALNAMGTSRWLGDADLVVGLMPYLAGDRYCGVAKIGGISSVSACSSKTLAHEIGHNFGLGHDFSSGSIGRKGYCLEGIGEDCAKGTIMAYASTRVPLFANKHFTYDGLPLGDDEHDAVTHLNKVKTRKALRSELSSQGYVDSFSKDSNPTEYALCR